MIVKRLKTSNFDDLDKDNVFQWQLEKMNEANMFNGDVIKELAKTTKISKKKLQSLIVDNGYQIADETDKEFSKFKGTEIPPLTNMDQQLKGYLNQTFLDIDNLVNQTLITTNYGVGSAQKIYEDIIKNTTAGVITGLKTPEKAISDTIYKWMDKGIPSSFVDKGGHTWSIESYVRMVVNTTTRNTYHEIRMEGMDRYGIETCLMSAHAAARPACAPIQGRVVYMRPSQSGDKYPSVYDRGYKEAAGVAGINCHHTFTPWDPDINIIRDKEDVPSPDEAIKNSDIQAKQRQLERQVRQYKRKLNVAKELGDEQGIARYTQLIRSNQSGIRKLVDDNDFLYRDYSREKVYGKATKQDKDKYTVPNADHVNFPIEKLTKYALNPENTHGGSDKARVFEAALGYNKSNYQSLYDQVMNNVHKYEATVTKVNEYGTSYSVVMNIKGPNGKQVPVVTGWLVDDNQRTRLTTIFVK